MKILQKLKFMLMRQDTPTETRPDDITSEKGVGNRTSGIEEKDDCCGNVCMTKPGQANGCCNDDHECSCC